ncbi:MAG: hypothetical protein JWM91_3534 [Rhodospirillales bacterium]|nr:hypothetical protein [Rhodospirillales bacterium]
MFARSLTAVTLAVLATAAVTSPAHADDTITNSTRVRYRDLDLTSDAGEAALKQRIARAAKNVCWNADGPTIENHVRFDTCRNDAIANASPQMNAAIASARSDHRYATNNDVIAMSGR